MKYRGTANKYLPILLVCSLTFGTYPYVFERLTTLPSLPALVVGCTFIGIVFLIWNKKTIKTDNNVFIIWGLQILAWLFLSVYHSDTSYITRITLLISSGVILTCCNTNRNGCTDLIKVLNYIIFAQAFLGAIAFFLVYFNLLHPFISFYNIDGRPAEFYLLTSTNYRIANFIRVAGYFDEPGALAFWGIYSLIFNKLFVNNQKIEKILIICLFFTFSLAYFLEIVLYLLLLYQKKIKSLFFPLILALIFTFSISNLNHISRDIFNKLVTLRINDNGVIQNNREEMTQKAIKYFYSSPILGIGAQHTEDLDYLNDNPMELFLKDGIIGYFFVYLPLFAAFVRGNKLQRFGVIILFINYQQRPFHINPMHFIYLNLLLLSILWKNQRFKSRQQFQLLQ